MAKLGKATAMRQEMLNIRKSFTTKLIKFKETEEENKKLKSDLEKSEMMCSGLKTGVAVLEERIKEKDSAIRKSIEANHKEICDLKEENTKMKKGIKALKEIHQDLKGN